MHALYKTNGIKYKLHKLFCPTKYILRTYIHISTMSYIVTDKGILFGQGGMVNQHRGNKD